MGLTRLPPRSLRDKQRVPKMENPPKPPPSRTVSGKTKEDDYDFPDFPKSEPIDNGPFMTKEGYRMVLWIIAIGVAIGYLLTTNN